MSEPISQKPYFVRAIFEWCTDNGFTPYIAVAVNSETVVPRGHVRNGEIVLNISALATHRLHISNESIAFTARFSGQAQDIWVPMEQVSAIYAKETGAGMAFEVAKPLGLTPEEEAAQQSFRPSSLELGSQVEGDGSGAAVSTSPDDDEPPRPTAPAGGRPALRRVK